MNKDIGYYRTLDLPQLAKTIPNDKEARARVEAYQEMLIALALRYSSETFTSADLLTFLGEPDAIKPLEDGETWEYSWRGEHCSQEYHSSTPFLVKDGRVIGIQRHVLTPTS